MKKWKSEKIENGGRRKSERIEKILISLIFIWLGGKKWSDVKNMFV